jgi:hypothetical protein
MAVKTDINSKGFWNTYLRATQIEAGETLGYKRNDIKLQALQQANHVVPDIRPVVYNLPIFYQAPANPCIDMSTHHHVTHVHLPAAPKTDEEEEQERADQAKCIGAILCGVAACLFGYAYNIYNRQQETMTKTRDLHAKVHDENLWAIANHEFGNNVQVITEDQLAIDELNTARINNYALAALIFLVSAGLIVTGGFLVAGALITAGEIGLVITGGVALWNLGAHWNDEEIIHRHCKEIAQRTQAVFFYLDLYNDDMTWKGGEKTLKGGVRPPAYAADDLYDVPPSAPTAPSNLD